MKQGGHSKKSDATRQLLLDAALRVIAQKGYTAATVDEIVQEAGVSKGLAYYHFKNKAAIATAILKNGIDQLTESFEQAAAESADASEALMGMLNAFASAVIDDRAFGRFLMSELWRDGRVWSDELRDDVMRLERIIDAQFRRGQEEGIVAKDEDTVFDAVSSIGLVLSTSLCYFSDGTDTEPLSKDEFTQRVRKFVAQATGINKPDTGQV